MDGEVRVKHLAGIIPIASNESFFNMPWHDSLMPLSHDYLAIEKSVFDCALAGCDTIWIVGHMNMQPLIRKRLGEMIYDPLKLYSGKEMNFKRHDAESKRIEIQIYYVPIHPKDRERRDSLGYSVLYGAETALKVCENISAWTIPRMFFCSFPYGIVSEESMYEFRKHANKTVNTIMSFEGKTVKDGLMLPFTFSLQDYRRCKSHIRDYAISIWDKNDRSTEHSPALHFSIKDVFAAVDTSQSTLLDSTWFHQINSWESYKKFLSSDESVKIRKREDLFLVNSKRTFRGQND
jgi:hypothetical protein